MKEFLRIAWAVLLYLWQLPQNLIGLVYLAFCFDRVKITKQGGAVFYATKHVRGGMTMGRYVFAFSVARLTTTIFILRGRQTASEEYPTTKGNTTTIWTD